ncbi:MAG: chromate efflux transporter [Armatimonadota bacterium]|nr:chromate efflux transporter [Armatimonadota bacterium]
MSRDGRRGRPASAVLEVVTLFLRLGCTAFGGPAAHIAMMRDEVVRRRRWLTDQEFLDLLGATNLIPGPNSTEMAIHVGVRRAGRPGLAAAGAAFILPAAAIVMGLSWAYVRYGAAPEAGWVLYGVRPVIIAVVVQALWALGRTAVRGPTLAAVGTVALALYFRGVNEIALLAASGLAVMGLRSGGRLRPDRAAAAVVAAAGAVVAAAAGTTAPFALTTMFLIFVKIGSVLYGSGYVLLAFLRADFVEHLGWLTDRQLLDAVAIGQFTPGPLFATATFVGYILGGVPAALLATVGIFLPAFVFVAVSHPFVPRMRRSPTAAALLDGVNVASLALMAGVSWHLGRAAITDAVTLVLALCSLALLLRSRVNSAWLVAGGAGAGFAVKLLGLS